MVVHLVFQKFRTLLNSMIWNHIKLWRKLKKGLKFNCVICFDILLLKSRQIIIDPGDLKIYLIMFGNWQGIPNKTLIGKEIQKKITTQLKIWGDKIKKTTPRLYFVPCILWIQKCLMIKGYQGFPFFGGFWVFFFRYVISILSHFYKLVSLSEWYFFSLLVQ